MQNIGFFLSVIFLLVFHHPTEGVKTAEHNVYVTSVIVEDLTLDNDEPKMNNISEEPEILMTIHPNKVVNMGGKK